MLIDICIQVGQEGSIDKFYILDIKKLLNDPRYGSTLSVIKVDYWTHGKGFLDDPEVEYGFKSGVICMSG